MRSFRRVAICFLIVLSLGAPGVAQEPDEHVHASAGSEEGLGSAHMEISCTPAVAAKFDRALALLHNFWYRRALEAFQQVSNVDPECAIAYWGAAIKEAGNDVRIELAGDATVLMRTAVSNSVTPVGWPPFSQALAKVVELKIPIFV